MKASGPTSLGVIQDKQASPALIGQLVTIGTSNKTRKVLSIVIIALFVVLLIIAIWLVIVSLFVPPYKKLMQSRTEIDNLQQQVDEQQTLLTRQTREVNLLKTDVSYLETIARDRLDLMKEGETIFRLETARAKTKPVAPARK